MSLIVLLSVVGPEGPEAGEEGDPAAGWIRSLGSDGYQERERAAEGLRAALGKLEDAGDADGLSRLLGELERELGETSDPQVRTTLGEIVGAFRMGAVLWSRPLPSAAEQSLLIPDMSLVVACGRRGDRGWAGAWSIQDGTPLWEISLGQAGPSHMVRAGDSVLIGGVRHEVDPKADPKMLDGFASPAWVGRYRLRDGGAVWVQKGFPHRSHTGEIALAGEKVVVGGIDPKTGEGAFVAFLDQASGKILWLKPAKDLPDGGGLLWAGPSPEGIRAVFLKSEEGKGSTARLALIDPADGSFVGKPSPFPLPFERRFLTLSGGGFAVGGKLRHFKDPDNDGTGRFACHGGASLKPAWEHRLHGYFCAVFVDPEQILISVFASNGAGRRSEIASLEAKSGTRRWAAEVPFLTMGIHAASKGVLAWGKTLEGCSFALLDPGSGRILDRWDPPMAPECIAAYPVDARGRTDLLAFERQAETHDPATGLGYFKGNITLYRLRDPLGTGK